MAWEFVPSDWVKEKEKDDDGGEKVGMEDDVVVGVVLVVVRNVVSAMNEVLVLVMNRNVVLFNRRNVKEVDTEFT
jgi:hypothetical protein